MFCSQSLSDSNSPRRLSLVYDLFHVRFPLTEECGHDPCDRTFQKNVEPAQSRCSHPFPGGHSGVVPPDPIPNSEVKRACADGSVALPCKSRSPPGALFQKASPIGEAFVFMAPAVAAATAIAGCDRPSPGALSGNTLTGNGGGFFLGCEIPIPSLLAIRHRL